MAGTRLETASGVSAAPATAGTSADATTFVKPSAEASSRIAADCAPVPYAVAAPDAESVVNPRSRNVAVPDGAPGERVAKETAPDSPATSKELVARTFA